MADELYDLIIIGGGLAGASLACALKNAKLMHAEVKGNEQQRPLKRAAFKHMTATVLFADASLA